MRWGSMSALRASASRVLTQLETSGVSAGRQGIVRETPDRPPELTPGGHAGLRKAVGGVDPLEFLPLL